ncbi:MAG: hypothetical protein V4494_04730 [Chlamydiota bacterium]
MSHAAGLACIFGPFLTIMGLWMLLYVDNLTKVMASIKSSPGCFYILGMLNLLIGLTVISRYNIWTADLSVLVTLLGWVMFIRGILVFFVPQFIIKTTMTKQKTIQYTGIVPLVWGLLLSWLAFHL